MDKNDKYSDVEVVCKTEISYERINQSDSWDSDDGNEFYTLYSKGSDYGEIDLDFNCSSYEEVYSVRIDDSECEINSVYGY